MTALYRMRTLLTGFNGGPGVSTMYFLDTATAVASVHTFWDAVKTYMADAVNIQVDAQGDVIEDTSGTITGAWGATPVAAINCSGSGTVAPAQGVQAKWLTSTILDGRRLRGRTFLVPTTTTLFTSSGEVSSVPLAAIATAAQNLVTAQSASFVVWHRPRPARAADGSRPAVTERTGGHGLVTGHSVPVKPVVLRSRRD